MTTFAEESILKKEVKKSVEIGVTGTDIFSGYIDVDYNIEWRNIKDRVLLIDKMIDGDGTISAMIDAINNPILSAKKSIDCEDEKIKEFTEKALFTELKGGFDSFLIQAMTFIPYGFSIFEKVYKIKDGLLYWDRLAPRIQKSIERWEIPNTTWINGHPAGITQVTQSTDEARHLSTEVYIPWDKIMLFTFKQIGNNFEGKSLLRRCFIHFTIKQLLYKISAISAERYGVGVPFIKHKIGLNDGVTTKYDELLMNIRSNEQAFARFDTNVEEFGILTPSGNAEKGSIQNLIDHHDKKMYDSILAGFLNLTSGEGGSNALSKDQSSFFLKSLNYITSYIASVIEEEIKKLVIINFGEQEKYPKLIFSDIGNISLDEIINAVAQSKQAGLISWSDSDENKIRQELKLGKREEKAVREEKEIASFAEKKTKPTERERSFMRNIGDFENYLESEYANVLAIIEPEEEKIKKELMKKYNSAETERIDGVIRLKYDKKLEKEMEKILDDSAKRLNEKLINSNYQKRLFDKTKQMAVKNLKDNNKFFAEIEIDEASFNSMIKGYISNTEAYIFNETRKIKEQVTLNLGSQVSVNLIASQVDGIKFNRNIVKLSTITHPRGAYNMITFNDNTANGFTFFKPLVPKQRMKDVAPTGKTSDLLFLILTAYAINKMASEETDGKTTEAITGLNIHHGAYLYFYPIASDELDEEEVIAEKQRQDFLNSNQDE